MQKSFSLRQRMDKEKLLYYDGRNGRRSPWLQERKENMEAVLEQIYKIGIVPVVKIDRAEDALPLAKALCAGGLPCAEVTFRTDAAAEAIKIMTENFPNMCVGAGTVLNAAQVDAAVAAGAKFIVSPGLNPRTVKYCQEKGVPITPGTSSPSDIEQAIELGKQSVRDQVK